jgi:vacuolar-type H+-ATPase subunit I/STV1
MLVEVYIAKELDKIDNWIENIADGNKVTETLHVEIHRLKDQIQEQTLEVEKHYSDAWKALNLELVVNCQPTSELLKLVANL